jgi:hypothetical protein
MRYLSFDCFCRVPENSAGRYIGYVVCPLHGKESTLIWITDTCLDCEKTIWMGPKGRRKRCNDCNKKYRRAYQKRHRTAKVPISHTTVFGEKKVSEKRVFDALSGVFKIETLDDKIKTPMLDKIIRIKTG